MSLKKVSFILVIVMLLLFFSTKLYTYMALTSNEMEGLSFEGKIAMFYEDKLRLPQNFLEFQSYIYNVDVDYYQKLKRINYKFLYDSINDEANIYASGMDWDDDQLKNIYVPKKCGFFGSFFKDGDVLVQKADVSSLIDYLVNKAVIIADGDKPSDGSFNNNLKSIIYCALNEVLVNDKPDDRSDTALWVELISLNGEVRLKLYGGIDSDKAINIEKSIIKKILEGQILNGYKEVRVGVHYDREYPPICLEI